MKVFISWSGDYSHEAAEKLKEWLPSVIQSIDPFVSSDIDKGARWAADIAGELETSDYGIICVTRENSHAPWIHFEAGALSKSLDKSYVSPLLLDLKRSEVVGPLTQFQNTLCEEADVRKLVTSLNDRTAAETRLSSTHLDRAFSRWWPDLQSQLRELAEKYQGTSTTPVPSDPKSRILEEVLELLRQQQRLLNNPERLLPSTYLQFALENAGPYGTGTDEYSPKMRQLHADLMKLQETLKAQAKGNPEFAEAFEQAAKMHNHFHGLAADGSPKPPRRIMPKLSYTFEAKRSTASEDTPPPGPTSPG